MDISLVFGNPPNGTVGILYLFESENMLDICGRFPSRLTTICGETGRCGSYKSPIYMSWNPQRLVQSFQEPATPFQRTLRSKNPCSTSG